MDINRTEQIKSYLKRLGEGEELEKVQQDFVKEFSEVEAMEIMNAEQELISEGYPLEEVQRLCDVHSALFHGKTREEQIANAEKEVAASIERSKQMGEEFQATAEDRKEKATQLKAIPGHPLNVLERENQALEPLIKEAQEALAAGEDVAELLTEIRPVITHYAKKGDLLYPHLKVQYGVTGPSNVMWTVDDEIRDELNKLIKEENHDEAYRDRVEKVLKRMEEMIYKEENILFPAVALTFTNRDWRQLYQDQKDYPEAFGIPIDIWEEAESNPIGKSTDEELLLPGGSLKLNELKALMKTLPAEVTFIDENDINKYFNEGPKVFKRPSIALGHDVFSCHPPKVERAVRKILDDFKSGKRDKVVLFSEKGGKPFRVTYLAVRDEDGKYIGTMELVEEMEEILNHYLPKDAKVKKEEPVSW